MINNTIYQKYLSALINSDKATCRQIVQSLLKENVDIIVLYEKLFQQSMYTVGEMWEKNKISVATEHSATFITQQMLMLVYPYLLNSKKNNKSVVVSSIANEFHQLGAHMVADIFQMHGWETYFLGGNTPINDLVLYIEHHQPDVLCLSLSIYFNLKDFLSTVSAIRENFLSLPLLVGGQAFQWGGRQFLENMSNIKYIGTLLELSVELEKERI